MIEAVAPDMIVVRAIAGTAIGAVVGSFAATAALRLADGRDPIWGRSQCDGCARPLGWAETVPFVGYVLTRGQCRCGSRIDGFHMAGEALGGMALVVPLIWMTGASAVVTGLLCLSLLVSALIDLKTLRLPDILTLAIAMCALVLAVMSGHIISGVIAAVVAAGVLYGLKVWLERRHAKPMLGLGDVKLVAALALWLGLRTPAMMALAAVLGLALVLIQKRRGAVPFGPMIAASAFVVGVLVPEGWLI